MSGNQHGQCLVEETLTDYLAGELNPAIKAASESHLIECDECRTRLALWMRLLQPETTPEELIALESIHKEWDARSQIKGLPVRTHAPTRWIWAFAALAAVLVLSVAAIWIVRERSAARDSASEVVRLLLKQNRPFEARLSDEPHWPIRRTRGPSDPGVSYNVLAGEMTRLAASSHEMGRFYLIQKDFSRAIPYLEMAAQEVGATAAVHNDLGVAYLESGDATQLDKAAAEFMRALQQEKDFATATFNLALFYERTNATAQAETQWKRYLQLDSNSEWAQEARGRLQGLSR